LKGTVIGGALLLVVPALATASSLGLLAAKDRPFCQQVLGLFRENMGGGDRVNIESEPFSHVKWDAAKLAGVAPKTRRCSSLDKALVDLDNDGTKDLVVKATFCMMGAPSDSLYVFPADSPVLEQTSWQNMAPLHATGNRFERTGGSYPLTAIPMLIASGEAQATLRSVFTVHPFLVRGMAYVALTDGQGEWIVVAKYLGGERFDDQCYLRGSGKS